MKATDLFNIRKEEFETNETFAKRVYETAKRYRSSLHFTAQESWHVLTILARYYKESVSDILSANRGYNVGKNIEINKGIYAKSVSEDRRLM